MSIDDPPLPLQMDRDKESAQAWEDSIDYAPLANVVLSFPTDMDWEAEVLPVVQGWLVSRVPSPLHSSPPLVEGLLLPPCPPH
jgi:hypothetical protein